MPARTTLASAAVLVLAIVATSGCGAGRPTPTAATADSLRPSPALNGRPGRRSYAPWPAFGHDAAHSGAATVRGPRTGHVRWRRRLEGPVVPGPVVGADATIYAASNGGVLHALDVRDGHERWRFGGGGTYGSDLSTAPLVMPDGTIVWPGPSNTVFGLARDGRLRWKLVVGGQPLSPALAPDGAVIIGDAAGGIRALRLRGVRPPAISWRAALGSSSYSSPAVGTDGTVYTTVDSALVAVRAGHVLWRVQAGDISEVSPAVTPDGTIVFAANDDVAYGVTPGGRVRWRYPIGALTYSSPAATRDGLVYLGDHRGRVTVLDARTGRPRARVLGLARTPTLRSVGVWTQPVLDAVHNVYFGTRPGHIYGFDARGRRLFDVATGATVDSYPALAGDGTLLVGSESGELLAIGAAARSSAETVTTR